MVIDMLNAFLSCKTLKKKVEEMVPDFHIVNGWSLLKFPFK